MKVAIDRTRRAALAVFACALLASPAILAQEPRATLVQRAVAATTFSDSIPGLPEGGNYAVVTFRTSFANQTESVEAVTLEVGADYGWHVIGYAIQ